MSNAIFTDVRSIKRLRERPTIADVKKLQAMVADRERAIVISILTVS